MVRSRGIRFVGVHDRSTNDLYMTRAEHYFDRDLFHQIDYTERGGTVQRFLPLQLFQRRFGKVKI